MSDVRIKFGMLRFSGTSASDLAAAISCASVVPPLLGISRSIAPRAMPSTYAGIHESHLRLLLMTDKSSFGSTLSLVANQSVTTSPPNPHCSRSRERHSHPWSAQYVPFSWLYAHLSTEDHPLIADVIRRLHLPAVVSLHMLSSISIVRRAHDGPWARFDDRSLEGGKVQFAQRPLVHVDVEGHAVILLECKFECKFECK